MLASRVLSRVSRSVGRRSSLLPVSASSGKYKLPTFSNQLHSLVNESPTKVSLFHHPAFSSSTFQRFWFSSASPEPNEKEQGSAVENDGDAKVSGEVEDAKVSGEVEDAGSEEAKATDRTEESGFNSEPQSVNRRRRGIKRTAFSDSDSDSELESDLSRDDLVKLVKEKNELLKAKQEEVEKTKDNALRTLAEMENVKFRAIREAENSKKFAIQSFAKGLLDVADNLGRASSIAKESFSKIDTANDTAGAVPLLKSLLEGVEMTEKQLAEAFRKSGVEKYDPTNEPFDPNMHNAVFQVPDNTKPPGTVAHVLKAGYMLHDRVLRPAEVGVTVEKDDEAEA